VQVRELTIHPAPLPRPALKYHLLPPLREQTPGNAALPYLRAFHSLSSSATNSAKALEKLQGEYLTMPLDKLPREEVRKALNEMDSVLRLAEMAARCQQCDWGRPAGDPGMIVAILLPEVQAARTVGRVLHAKVRIAIVERRYDEALSTLRTSFSLARDMGRHSMFVTDTLGFALQGMFVDALESLAASAGSPNLYWAIAELPTPLVNVRESIGWEADGLYSTVPDLRDVKTASRPPELWEKLLAQLLWARAVDLEESPREPSKADIGAFVEKAYPIARRELTARGWTAQQVDSIPRAQVVVIAAVEIYEAARDDAFKWLYVPYSTARHRMEATAKEIAELSRKEPLSLMSTLLPTIAIGAMHCVQARAERELATIRCIEAIRAYAASHPGKLPQGLDQITDVPIPENPFTGKPFPYRVENQTAILDVEGPPESAPRQYRLRLAK
jgi:hypothetical protein